MQGVHHPFWIAVLTLSFLGVAGVTLLELVQLVRPSGPLSRSHHILRFLAGTTLLTIIFMILAAPAILKGKTTRFLIEYWSVCLFLSPILLVIGLLDLRRVWYLYMDQRDQLWKRLPPTMQQDDEPS